MSKILSNPFFVYVISFGIVVVVYLLGWSLLYPPLSPSVLTFFIVSGIVSLLFGIWIHTLKRIQYRDVEWSSRMPLYVMIILLGYVLEFIYNGGVPLILILFGADYDYTQFGIPTFHVFLVTFSSFLSVYIFHELRFSFGKRKLFWFLASITPPILIVNRGMLLMILTACLFVYLLSLNRLGFRKVMLLTCIILAIFYLFGVLGNLRQTNGNSSSSDYILEVSMATSEFRNSLVPSEYIWAYLYISSPLANLQHSINNGVISDSWIGFINYELLPDFISMRTGKAMDLTRETTPRVAPWLTVSTMYANSYLFVGWVGIVIIYLFFISTTFFYVMILRKQSKFYVTGLAILNTLVLYNTFDNMYGFTGLNFQLLYPLIFSYVKFPTLNLTSLTKYIPR